MLIHSSFNHFSLFGSISWESGFWFISSTNAVSEVLRFEVDGGWNGRSIWWSVQSDGNAFFKFSKRSIPVFRLLLLLLLSVIGFLDKLLCRSGFDSSGSWSWRGTDAEITWLTVTVTVPRLLYLMAFERRPPSTSAYQWPYWDTVLLQRDGLLS